MELSVRRPATVVSGVRVRRPRPGTAEAALVACGGALAALVALDGDPVWQAVRLCAVVATTAVALRVVRRAPGRGAGRAAVALAVPALAVAAGFLPHLVKGGPLPVRLATAVLAGGAVVLAVAGTATATRGRGRVRRTGAAVVVVVMTAVTGLVVGPAVAATNVPRPRLGATPARVGLAYEDVRLRTADGVTLAGWYVPSRNRAAIVLLHGAGSTRSDVLAEAAVLAGAGFGVLLVDARGHGESGGRAMDFGWHGDADVAAATAHLARRPDVDRDRIAAVGLSMGGEQALGAAGANILLRAVVAEGATARTAADEAWLSGRYGVRGAVQEVLERVRDVVTDVLTSASVPRSLRDAVRASDAPVLLIAAGDVADEPAAASYIAGGSPDRVAVWTVEGAGHVGGLATAPDEWADRVVGFLGDALRVETSR